jgi:hypothetical protein
MGLISYLMNYLELETRLLTQSELNINGKGTQLLVDICHHLGANEYLASKAAHKHIDADLFKRAGIQLSFYKPVAPRYPQLWGPFIANLSAFDLVFTCGPKARDRVRGCQAARIR